MYSESEKLLTERETDVLICIYKGLSNPQIANRLCISISTVKAHISSIFAKLHAKNRIDVLLMLVGEKMITNEEIRKQIAELDYKMCSNI